jgi:hypothetical protein
VEYAPEPWFAGGDSFQFQANDGGVAPDGGDSNVATLSITIGELQRVHGFSLDTNPGWDTQGQWQWGLPTGGGSYAGDPTGGYTGAYVYGYNLQGDYGLNIPVNFLTTTALDCSDLTDSELRFRRWLGIEPAAYDHATVQVSNDGTNWTTVWNHVGDAISESSWSLQTYDIAATADGRPQVFIRWGMGPTDGYVTYPGWNIDDIEIWAVRPLSDCNGNGTPDYQDIGSQASPDCNSNGVPDECDIDPLDPDGNGQVSPDSQPNGIPDECEFLPVDPPVAPDGEAGFKKNRYISFISANPGRQSAMRVTLSTLPTEFSAHEGTHVWVSFPVEICENSGQAEPPPGGCGYASGASELSFESANLQTTQYCHDFGSVGLLHVTGCEIVPGATYTVQAIDCAVDPGIETNYSAPLTINTSVGGDICGSYDVANDRWSEPDGSVDIVFDVTACIEKFKNAIGAPIKPRADIAPTVPEWKVNVTSDVTRIIDALGGASYPFSGPGSCP